MAELASTAPLVGFAIGWVVSNSGRHSSPVMPVVEETRTATTTPQKESVTAATGAALPRNATERDSVRGANPPPKTLREALSHASEFHRIGEFATLLDGLGADQFQTLLAEMTTMQPPPQAEVMALFFRRWALVAPREALTASIACDSSISVLMAWAESDPDAALAAFDKMSSIQGFAAASTRDHLRKMAMPKPGKLPPREAVLRIRQLQGDGDATPAVLNSISAILTDWVKTDAQAAWQEALELPNGGTGRETRERALGAVIRAQVAADPKVAFDWINRLPSGTERERREVDYVGALAWQGNQRLAQEYAFAMPPGDSRIKAIGQLTSALNRSDPEGARSLVLALGADDWKDPTAFSDVLQGWMRSEPEQAVQVLLQRFPFGDPTLVEKEEAYQDMFFGFAHRNPELALDLFLKLPESIGTKLLEQGVKTFTFSDPAAASKWAERLPEGAPRDGVLMTISGQWTQRGVGSVTAWLQQMPEGTGKAAAIEGFARAIVSNSPEDALAWLRAIPVERDRLGRLRRVWNAWQDREAARKWAESSPELTASERAALVGNASAR
jgi:hypothetical protein